MPSSRIRPGTDVDYVELATGLRAARTRATDANFTAGEFLEFENRAVVAGNDNFRRRVIAGRVRPRNIGAAGSI